MHFTQQIIQMVLAIGLAKMFQLTITPTKNKMQKKTCMATTTSPIVGGVVRSYMLHSPSPPRLSLVAVPSH